MNFVFPKNDIIIINGKHFYNKPVNLDLCFNIHPAQNNNPGHYVIMFESTYKEFYTAWSYSSEKDRSEEFKRLRTIIEVDLTN